METQICSLAGYIIYGGLRKGLLGQYLKLQSMSMCLLYIGIAMLLALFQQEFSLIPQLNQKMVDADSNLSTTIEKIMKMRWVLIITPAIVILVRMLMISLCLFVGSFFFFTSDETNSFGRWWNIVVKAQVVMILYGIAISLISIFVSFEAAQNFPKTVSLMTFWGESIPEQWMQIPLLSINIFELVFWLFMTILIIREMSITFRESFEFVIMSYVIPYCIYICFLTFITMYVS